LRRADSPVCPAPDASVPLLTAIRSYRFVKKGSGALFRSRFDPRSHSCSHAGHRFQENFLSPSTPQACRENRVLLSGPFEPPQAIIKCEGGRKTDSRNGSKNGSARIGPIHREIELVVNRGRSGNAFPVFPRSLLQGKKMARRGRNRVAENRLAARMSGPITCEIAAYHSSIRATTLA
jgi:hypothetical protein